MPELSACESASESAGSHLGGNARAVHMDCSRLSPWKLLLGTFWGSSKTLATCFPPGHFFLKAFPRGRIRCSCDISAMLRCEDLTVRQSPFWPFSRWWDYEPGEILSFNIRAHVSMTRHLRTLRGPMLTSEHFASQVAATDNFNVIFVRVDGLLYLCSPYGDFFCDLAVVEDS